MYCNSEQITLQKQHANILTRGGFTKQLFAIELLELRAALIKSRCTLIQ